MYSADEKRLISVLAKKLKRLNIKIENIQVKEDPEWELYDSLFPTESEIMPLINRTRIETLYSKGVFSNKEYNVSFYVSFKNKNDPVLFEENVVHLGLKLVFASFEEDDEESEGFAYFGEYQTDTFVTPRRIDYLCEEIQKVSDDLNAFFSGDWLVNQ